MPIRDRDLGRYRNPAIGFTSYNEYKKWIRKKKIKKLFEKK